MITHRTPCSADRAAYARHNALATGGRPASMADLAPHGPLTAERTAMERDPVAFGAYLGRVALRARQAFADGDTLREAIDFAFGMTDDVPVELTDREPSHMERDAVSILADVLPR
jgi:hypothetical protein